MTRSTDARARVLTALLLLREATALELQGETGISATSIRPILAGPECERIGFKGEGRQRQIVYRIKPEEVSGFSMGR